MSAHESDSSSSGSNSADESPVLPPAILSPPLDLRNEGQSAHRPSRHGSGSGVRPASLFAHTSLSQERIAPNQVTNAASAPMTPDARRQNMIAMDRKRRLTGSTSTYDHPRRRYTPSEYPRRTESQVQLPWEVNPSQLAPAPRDGNEGRPSEVQVVDLTGSSPLPPPPPPPPPHSPVRYSQPSRTSSSSSRRYVVPPWQPDSEVSHCPICKRQFHFMFRRHHCRKCGRVVCDSCSPHRITIPRQFIVNPPRPDLLSSPTESRPETVDLTGDDEEDIVQRGQRRIKHSSLSTLEGGEKVRLCNPCVPDPQPDPSPNFPQFSIEANSAEPGARFPPPSYPNYPVGSFQANDFGPSRRISNTPVLQSGREGMTATRFDYPISTGSRPRQSSTANAHSVYHSQTEARSVAGQSGVGSMFLGGRQGNGNGSASSLTPHSLFDQLAQSSLPPLPGMGAFQSSAYGHGRYSSMDGQFRPPSSFSGRPRGSSMFDLDHRQGNGAASYHSRLVTPTSSRPRIHERDICPVCRRALPPRGDNGDESAREAHIMDCISARDVSAPGTGPAGSSRGSVHWVEFTSSEKDCVGEEGNAQECSICMVEYEVGDQLARLECFCKFHKECIVSWLSRKAECPVHKAARFNV